MNLIEKNSPKSIMLDFEFEKVGKTEFPIEKKMSDAGDNTISKEEDSTKVQSKRKRASKEIVSEKTKEKIQKVIKVTGYSDLPNILKEYINTFLFNNKDLNALRLSEKIQAKLVKNVRIMRIKEGKSAEELGFKSFAVFKSYIGDHQDKDYLIKLAMVNSINNGESFDLKKWGFKKCDDFFIYLGKKNLNKITNINLKRFFKEKPVNDYIKIIVIDKKLIKRLSLKFPNIKQLDLIDCAIVSRDNESVFETLSNTFPRLTSLSLNQHSINDERAQYLKNFKQLQVLEINNTLSSLLFLKDLESLKVLILNGYEKDIPKDLHLPRNLEEVYLINLVQLTNRAFLEGCPYLKVINIQNCPNVEN